MDVEQKILNPIEAFFPHIRGTEQELVFEGVFNLSGTEKLSYLKTVKNDHLSVNRCRKLFEEKYKAGPSNVGIMPNEIHYMYASSQKINLKDRFVSSRKCAKASYESVKSWVRVFTFNENGYININPHNMLEVSAIGKLMLLRWDPSFSEQSFDALVCQAFCDLGINKDMEVFYHPVEVLEDALYQSFKSNEKLLGSYYYIKYHLLKASQSSNGLSKRDLESVVEALDFFCMHIGAFATPWRNKTLQILESALPRIIEDLEYHYQGRSVRASFDNILSMVFSVHSIFSKDRELPFETGGESVSGRVLRGILVLILSYHQRWSALVNFTLDVSCKNEIAKLMMSFIPHVGENIKFHLFNAIPEGTFEELYAQQQLAQMIYSKHYAGDAPTSQAFACAQVYINRLIDKANSLFFIHTNSDNWPEEARNAYAWALNEAKAWYKDYPMACGIDKKYPQALSEAAQSMFS